MQALITLAILSAVLFSATLFLPIIAWPWSPEVADGAGAASDTVAAVLLGAYARFGVLAAGVLAAPLLLLAWLALPHRDHRSFPIVLALWIVACVTSFLPVWRPGGLALFCVACAPALLTGEVLRALFTRIVHRAMDPAESTPLSV